LTYIVVIKSNAACASPSPPINYDNHSLRRPIRISSRTTANLVGLFQLHGRRPHLYADDTRINGRCSPDHIDALDEHIAACTDDSFALDEVDAEKTERM
jgi:hypothetical protein